jgi:hypothetical protein
MRNSGATDQSPTAKLAGPIGLNERIKRGVDWVLVPISAGLVTNLFISAFIGTQALDGWSSKNLIATFALIITAGAKAYLDLSVVKGAHK